MPTMLKVKPEIASKIQARARERSVSVDVYLRELIDQKGTESKRSGKKVGGTEDLAKALDYRVVKIAVYSLTEDSRSPFQAEPDFDFISSPFHFNYIG